MNNAGIWMAQKAEWEAEDPEGKGPLKRRAFVLASNGSE